MSIVLDKSVLRKLVSFVDDVAFGREIIDTFLEEIEELIPQIKQALKHNDEKQLYYVLHNQKNNSGNIGAVNLTAHLTRMEKMPLHLVDDNAGGCLTDLQKHIDEAKHEIVAWRDSSFRADA